MFKRIKKRFQRFLGLRYENVEELRKRGIIIGENVSIIDSFFDGSHGYLITIGNNVTITNATILTHDASTKKFIDRSKIGRVTIEDNVFIGYGAIILPNTHIGSNVIIGAGAVITGEIEANSVYVGSPAKKISTFDEYISKNEQNLKQTIDFGSITFNSNQEKIEAIKEMAIIGKIFYDV